MQSDKPMIANPYRKAHFLQSALNLAQCPAEVGVEVAFAGRSNAGKSSAINTLTDNKNLARTSKTPGRTQLLNFFRIDNSRCLVDLPGYGYAKVSKSIKRQWDINISEYLRCRKGLRGIVLLMDIRHPLQQFDTMVINWAVEAEMRVHILLTKSDKLGNGAANNMRLKVCRHLQDANVDDLVSVQTFSARKSEGLERLIDTLNKLLESTKS